MQAMHRRRMEGNALQYVIAPCMYLRMPLHRGGSHCAAGPVPCSAEPDACHGCMASHQFIQDLSRRHGLASFHPRCACHGCMASHQFIQGATAARPRISSSKVQPVVSALHDVPIDLAVAKSPGPPRRRHHPDLVTRQPSKVQHLHFPCRTIYDHYPHRQRRSHILAASSPFSSRPWNPRLPSPAPASRRGQAPCSGIVEDRVTSGSAATSPSPLRFATRNPSRSPPSLPPSRAESGLPIPQAAGRDKGPSTSSGPRGGPE